MTLADRLSPAAKNAATNMKKADSLITNSTKKSSNAMAGLSRSAGLVKGALIGVAAVAGSRFVGAFIRAGSQVETLTTQFETILGSAGAARERMEELTNFAAKTPFQLQGVANASRTLQTLTRGVLSTGDGLRLVGDAAAASGADFENLAIHVGRAYSGLQANRPVGESLMRLQELGLVTGETRNEIEKLTKGGMGKRAWELLQKELKLADGGMERLSKTVPGLASTIKDQLNLAMVKITSSGLWDQLRKGMEGVTAVFDKALQNGTFEKVGMVLFNTSQIIRSTVATSFNFLGTVITNVAVIWLDAMSKITGAASWLVDKLPAKLRPKWASGLSDLSEAFDFNAKAMSEASAQFADNTVGNFNRVREGFVDLTTTIKTSGADIKKQLEDSAGGDTSGASTSREKAIAVTADPSAVKEIHQEFTKIGRTERDKELMDIKFWYDEQMELLKGNKAAQAELERVYLDQRLQVYRDYASKEKKLDEDIYRNRVQNYMALGSAIGRALGTGFTGQEKGIKEAFKGTLSVTLDFLQNQLIASIVGNQLKNFMTLGPVGLIKAAGETALITGIFSAAKSGIQSFQSGGVIQRQPGFPETGDRTPIFANPGELILNRAQQKNLAQSGGSSYSVSIGGTTINVYGNATDEVIDRIDQTMQERNEELRMQLLELSDQGRINGVTF